MIPIHWDYISVSLRVWFRSSFSHRSCLWRTCKVLLPKARKWKFLVQNIDWRPMCICQALPRWRLCQRSAYVGQVCKVQVLGRLSREESMPFRIQQWKIFVFKVHISWVSPSWLSTWLGLPWIQGARDSVCGTLGWNMFDGLGKKKI